MANQQIGIYVLGARDSSIVRLVKDVNSVHDTDIQVLGFIDQNWRDLPEYFHGSPVIQTNPNPEMGGSDEIYLVNSIASSMRERVKVTSLWQQSGWKFMNLVHPSVNLEMVEIGDENLVFEGFLGPGTRIGNHNVIRPGGYVGHDSIVEDHCFVGPNATLCGDGFLDTESFIGAGATVLPHLRVGKGAIVGAGALVTKDVLPGKTVVGAPAKGTVGEGL